jgi:hypothetical protein
MAIKKMQHVRIDEVIEISRKNKENTANIE